MSLENATRFLSVQEVAPIQPQAGPASRRAVSSISERRRATDKMLEDLLSSAMLASDDDLRRILLELDNITKTLRSSSPDAQAIKLASHPAIWSAMKQALLDRELRHLALTDDLTGLYNRRGFFAAAAQALKLAERKGSSLLLFFCDVDYLKLINDSWGHHAGDHALVRAADALEQTFRNSDVLARIGGDEFAVLSMEAPSHSQITILRRLEKNLKKRSVDENRYTLSMSVGVARFDGRHPVSLGELMTDADQRMYDQKRARSNTNLGKLKADKTNGHSAKLVLATER